MATVQHAPWVEGWPTTTVTLDTGVEPDRTAHILRRKDLPYGHPDKLSIRTAAEMLGVDIEAALRDIRGDEWGEWEWRAEPITMDRWVEYVYTFWANAYLRRMRKHLLPDTGACDAPPASVSP